MIENGKGFKRNSHDTVTQCAVFLCCCFWTTGERPEVISSNEIVHEQVPDLCTVINIITPTLDTIVFKIKNFLKFEGCID